ncbi:MAG: hypothetical protein WBA07_09850 [Rivularia sp. (in: cyanobacteria)]
MKQLSPTYSAVDSKLKTLKLTWNDARVQAYIAQLSKIRRQRYTAATLPSKHYARLYQFLEVYERIQQMIRACRGSWNDEIISNFFRHRSVRKRAGQSTNRLKLEDWEELEKIVKNHYMPF